jgi:glucose 1-dehydrogenase
MSDAPELPQQPNLPKYDVHKCLKGQKAIVTGANSGIGKASAIALAQAGADVVVNYVSNKPAADEVVKVIKSHGVDGFCYDCDVSQEDQVQAMFAEMVKKFGRCDILVNNAGLQADSSFAEMTLEKWNKVIGINLTGQFLCAREAVRNFIKQGVDPKLSVAAGKIVSMSSVHQGIPWSGHVNYATSKGGIMMMNKSMAQELAPQRIRINSIGPGAIKTPINTEAWDTPTAYEELMKLIPYDRIGVPEDIAQVVIWLASDHSDYLNGATIYCDGGMMLYPGFRTGG